MFGRELTLGTFGNDNYGRTIADLLLSDDTHVNHMLVKDDWCWWYRKYAPGDTVLEELEQKAREAKKGLWADPRPVPLWEWGAQCRDAAKGSPHAQYEYPDPYTETHQWIVHTVSMVPL